MGATRPWGCEGLRSPSPSVVNLRACSWQLGASSQAPTGRQGCGESSTAVTNEASLLQSGLPEASGFRGSAAVFTAVTDGSALRTRSSESCAAQNTHGC